MAEQQPARRVAANFNQGWGIAAFVTALAVGAFVAAGVIKSRTFHSPNDVTAPASGEAAAH